MPVDLARRAAAECVGTLFLVATVVGSGIMADRLADGNVALALLGNTIPTGAILVVLILIFGPVSSAHFNPAVSTVFAIKGDLPREEAVVYIVAQIAGGVLGTFIAHGMFEETVVQFSTTERSGGGQWLGEVVATFGLVATILGCVRFKPDAVAYAVGLYITAAYWFTSSTSFANPAVTIARGFSDTFAGIRPLDVPIFIAMQIAGGIAALAFFSWLLASDRQRAEAPAAET